MRKRKFAIGAFVLAFIMTTLCFGVFYAQSDIIYDYEITAIYEYQGKIDAIDIKKNRDFSGEGNVLLIAVKEKGDLIKSKVVYLDAALPKGLNEIKVGDISIEDG